MAVRVPDDDFAGLVGRMIHRLIRGLADDGAAVVLISSDLDEIVAESDRVAVMHDGRITGILARADCSPEAIMQLAVA